MWMSIHTASPTPRCLPLLPLGCCSKKKKMLKPEVECPQWVWPWKISIREKHKKKTEAWDPWFGTLGILKQNRAGLSFLQETRPSWPLRTGKRRRPALTYMRHADALHKLTGQGWNHRADNVTDFPSGSPRTQLIWDSWVMRVCTPSASWWEMCF